MKMLTGLPLSLASQLLQGIFGVRGNGAGTKKRPEGRFLITAKA
jgi:hypothetical protein